MKVQDVNKLRVNMSKLARIAPQEIGKAVRQNGDELVRTAKILAPVGKTGKTRAAIHGELTPEGYKADMGPLSKVLEGGRKAGKSKSGKAYGAMRAQPFVNPALSATQKKRSARLRRAANKAVKMAMNGNG